MKKIMSIASTFLIMNMLLTSCASSNNETSINIVDIGTKDLIDPVSKGQELNANKVASGANDFAFKLSSLLLKKYGHKNFVLSPYSVWMPLAALVNTTNKKLKAKLKIEPINTKSKSICCGDSFYGLIPDEEVKEKMKIRAEKMPCEDVIVYCISCIKSMYIGGKKPHYLADLLFCEETLIKTYEPRKWHRELDNFIKKH